MQACSPTWEGPDSLDKFHRPLRVDGHLAVSVILARGQGLKHHRFIPASCKAFSAQAHRDRDCEQRASFKLLFNPLSDQPHASQCPT